MFPFGEELDEAIHLLALQAQIHIVQNVDVVGEHVAPCDTVAVLVGVNGVAEIEVMGGLFPAAEMHEDLIFNTPAGISGELGPLAVIKGGHRLDEPDGADGDQVFLIPIAGVVFLDNMRHQSQIVLDEHVAGGVVALLQAEQAVQLLLLGQRFGEGADGADMQGEKEHIGQSKQ